MDAPYAMVYVYMPLCRSDQGIPMAALPVSKAFIRDVPWLDFVKESALDTFELLRRDHHGDQAQLPSLDPNDWKLVESRPQTRVPRQPFGYSTTMDYDIVMHYEIVPKEGHVRQ